MKNLLRSSPKWLGVFAVLIAIAIFNVGGSETLDKEVKPDTRPQEGNSVFQDQAGKNDHQVDLGYVGNAMALSYLPQGSRANKAKEYYWCGTPFLQALVEGVQYPELLLLQQAKEVQAELAPEELINGPFITEAMCETEGCRGSISVKEYWSRSKLVDATTGIPVNPERKDSPDDGSSAR